ncbi:hypothetical protein Undi14_14440 [Undibacterium sp. 14-3-2]|uniref:hypothetical protein n=1 Tax=Undibacterium sp. 14-3-2 TaxID=2800129 RepID=UPI001908B5DE|nr:hypothetical protein [Undibacterium sp. 14-3-2]MBK1891235.1 hypothetical protein [Undibacterium sp. 14-3-2]
MVISTDAIAAVTPVRLPALSAVSSVSAATVAAGTVSSTASVVDVSSLSQTLAVTIALLGRQMKAIATSGSAAPIGDAATNFATTASLANLFVKAFNTFQSGNVNSIQNPLTSFLDSSLLDAMGGVLADSGNNLLESLSKIGITLDTSLSADNTQFSLDTVVLQKAYASAPLATATLLTQALQALAQIETTLIAQNQSLTSAETNNAVVDNSVSSTSFANASATAAGVVTSVAEPVASNHLLVQETVAAKTADITVGQSSEVGKNGATSISADKQMSVPSEAVNIPPSALNTTAFNVTSSAAATQASAALGNPTVDLSATNSVHASDNASTIAAQAQTLLSDDVLGALLVSDTNFIQTGLADIAEIGSYGVTANSLSSASVDNVLNTVSSSQELAGAVSDRINAGAVNTTASSEAVIANPALVKVSDVTGSTYGLNNVSVENTLINNANAAASEFAASTGLSGTATATAATTAVTVDAINNASGVAATLLPLPGGVNPAISAAVAAYKMGDAIEHQRSGDDQGETDEIVFDNEIPPVAMDLKQHASQQGANEAAGNKKHAQAKNVENPADVSMNLQTAGNIDVNV